VVQQVSRAFDEYWNSAAAVPMAALIDEPIGTEDLNRARDYITAHANEARLSPYRAAFDNSLAELLEFNIDRFHWEKWSLVVDPPEKVEEDFEHRRSEQLTAQLRPTAETAQEELVVVSPYFVPGDRGLAWFRRLRERGVRVVIVTNSLSSTNVPPVHAGYAGSRRALLEAGVELWEIRADPAWQKRQRRGLGYSASSLHTKALAIDRRHLFVGSFNFDPRSVDINTEMGIVVDSPSMATAAVENLLRALPSQAYRLRVDSDRDLEWVARVDDREVVYRTEPHTGFWQRFSVGCMRLLPISGQL
jgi:putative cardiolipin synthase